MYSHLKEKCRDCYFWIHSDLPGVTNGDCCRFPVKEPKLIDDGCGEFKEIKFVEILREEKKR